MGPDLKRLLRLLAVALAVLVLSGCRVAVDVAVDVAPDGSGVLAVTATADAAARADVGLADPLDGVAAAGQALVAEGWRSMDTTSPDGARAVALEVDFADPAGLERLTTQLADALAATEARPLEPLQLTVTDDRLRLEGSAAIEPTAAVADAGYSPEQVVGLLEERDALGYTVRATFPGEVVSADGARVEERTVVWEVAPGERVDLVAEAVRPQPVWPWVVGAVAGGLVLWLLVLVVRRRQRTAAAA